MGLEFENRRSHRRRSKAAGRRRQQGASQFYDAGCEALYREDYETAREKLHRACELEPENVTYLTTFGSMLAEVGPPEQAITILTKAVELAPEQGFESYMYLGQLLDGEQAVESIRKGVQVFERQIQAFESAGGGGVEGQSDSDEDEEPTSDDLHATLCSALCSLAEVLMTNASDIEQVEAECESVLQRAMRECTTSPEPVQALSSLRLEQGRREEAADLLQQSLKLWYRPDDVDDDVAEPAGGGTSGRNVPGAAGQAVEEEPLGDKADDKDDDDDDDDDDDMEDDDPQVPPLESRLACAQLMLELDQDVETVVDILEGCIAEDDTCLEVWHVLCIAQHKAGALQEAMETVEETVSLARQAGLGDDDPLVADLLQLKATIQSSGPTS